MTKRTPLIGVFGRFIILALAVACLIFSLPYLASFNDVPQLTSRPSPLQTEHPEWLIATMIPVHGVARRMVIRHTWQRLYAKPSTWTTRFVIARAPNALWQEIIKAENKTYGDLIQLPHLEENSHVANTVKSVEFFKHLSKTHNPLPWKFVSKIDDDSFLDAKTFYRDFLASRRTANRTIIGRTLPAPNYHYAGGQFYTLTDDMVSLVDHLHIQNPITDEDEDKLVGRLLYEAHEDWNLVDLPSRIAFDYEDKQLREEGKAFAAKDADLNAWAHAVGPESINPHKMKDQATYLKVAACFDEHGVIR